MYLERFSILIISLIASGCLFVASLSSTSDRPEKSSSNNSQKDDLVIEAAKLDQLVQEERVYNFDRLEALNDPYARISTEFDIPNSLKMRVAFWFDIYTLYNKNQHVIHHTLFPWIVYEVVDISNFLNNGKGPLWLRKQRGLDYVKARKKYIRNVLRKLSKSRSFKRLKSFERDIYNSLLKIPGKI